MLMFHAEMTPMAKPTGGNINKDLREKGPPILYPEPLQTDMYQYSTFLTSRPPVLKTTTVRELIRLAIAVLTPHVYIAHVSSAEVLPIIRNAQKRGINISTEACCHYLTLRAEEVLLRDTRFKDEPPIRNNRNRKELWQSLARSWDEHCLPDESSPLLHQPISVVVSNHSPCGSQTSAVVHSSAC